MKNWVVGALVLSGCGNAIVIGETGGSSATGDAVTVTVTTVAGTTTGAANGGAPSTSDDVAVSSSAAGADGGAPPVFNGYVDIHLEQGTGNVVAETHVFATPSKKPVDCGRTQQGSCYYETCPYEGASIPAGKASIDAGKTEVEMLFYGDPSGDYYGGYSGPVDSVFTDGDVLSYAIEGKAASGNKPQVPAMSVTTPATERVTLDQTVADYESIDRSKDLTVTWAPVGSLVTLCMGPKVNAGNGGEVCCTVPGADGTLTVPSALLQKLDKGIAAPMEAWTEQSASTEVDGWMLRGSVHSDALDGVGAIFLRNTVFE